MRFRSIDRLQDFEFHDSKWTLVHHDPSSFAFEVKELNLHQDASQNPEECDMEIETARVSFPGFRMAAYVPGATWKQDASGKSYPAEPQKTYTGNEALELFLRDANHGIWVYSLEKTNTAEWRLSCCGEEPYFEVRFTFGQAIIEWDSLRCPAWYVLHARGIQA